MFLTIFTPTYNRAHTLGRLYDSLCKQKCIDGFEWLVVDDGSTDKTRELIQSYIEENKIPIRYIYKENGGLYTGYNTAYANMDSELSMCMDSDDYLPDGAIATIEREWRERGSDRYAGLLGLAYNHDDMNPIAGKFPASMKECFYYELFLKKIHTGDSAPVMRTNLMKKVAPLIGFEGEKSINPFYLILEVCNDYPILVVNESLMVKEYQKTDSMSKAIYKQYWNSPRSFCKMRLQEMGMKQNSIRNKFRCAIHYVATSIISKDSRWLQNSPEKLITLLAAPLGVLWFAYIWYRNSEGKKNDKSNYLG